MVNNAKSKFYKVYFPGFISLICIPLLCVYLFFERKPQQYGRLQFITISKQNFIESDKLRLSIKATLKASRNYNYLCFSGNQVHDNNERKYLMSLVKQLTSKRDTINGVVVELSSHSKYIYLVDIVDLCHRPENKNIIYTFYNNRFYIRYISFKNTVIDCTLSKMPL